MGLLIMGNYHIHVFILIPDILVDIFHVQGGRVFQILGERLSSLQQKVQVYSIRRQTLNP